MNDKIEELYESDGTKIGQKEDNGFLEYLIREYGENVVDLMQKIVKIDGIADINYMVFMNNPSSKKLMCSMNFSEKYCIEVSKGYPELELDLFNRMSDRDKLKEIDIIAKSISAMINSMEKIKVGFLEFSKELLTVKKEIKRSMR